MKKKKEHATVKLGEYTVPIIGIPMDATQEDCSRCWKPKHLSEMTMDEDCKPVCQTCKEAV